MSTDPYFSVEGKVVVLTGGCGLIGRTVSRAFAERGAHVVLCDLPVSEPADVAAALPGRAAGFDLDVANEDQVSAVRDKIVAEFGRVDVLINNHQADPPGFDDATPEDFPLELWSEIVNVNLTGTFLTCRAFGKVMLSQGAGSIVNMASTYGIVSSNPDLYEDNSVGNPLAYSASKGGVIMLSKYLGVHWASRGVRVNCITPHGVSNGHEDEFRSRFERKSPMGRMMTPNEVVGAMIFLASDASSYATASNLLVEGGWTAW